VPLYILSASDLGITPEKVEGALDTALECCALWNALLLLDEADVFLESRTGGNLQRNELVSIFLRRLEYYEGVMFLTTNRINAIDAAFKSRLDLILPYYNLGPEARRKVWKNFIQKMAVGTAQFCEEDFDEMVKVEMNGREIKNSIKTALVLAARDAPFRMKHVRVVLSIRGRVPVASSEDTREDSVKE
jgi:AAA+ superfamily predicted ATPase